MAKSLHSCPSTELNISTPREDYYPSNAEYRKSLGETGSTYTRRAFRSTGHNRSRLPCILPPSPSPPLSTLYTLHPLLSSRYSSLLPPRGGLGGGSSQSLEKKNRSIADALSIIIHSLSRNESRVESIIAGQGLTEVQAIENNRGDRRACTDRAIEIATERYR